MAVFDIDPNLPCIHVARCLAQTCSEEELHFESVVRRRDGTEIPVDISVSHMEIDGKELACAILKDISARNERKNPAACLNKSSTAPRR